MGERMVGLTACSRERYHKSEVLSELLKLQKEMVSLTFLADQAASEDLKLWDVVQCLEKRMEEQGQDCKELFQRFKKESGEINNLIRSEISGTVGERKVVERIEKMSIQHRCLHNIELMDGQYKSEIDSLVITAKGIYIIEVKNTQKNIFIDEKGDYYRTGEYLKWDSNVGKKMAYRKLLIENVLKAGGKRVYPIKSLVVFTNNRIEVNNRSESLRTCFLSQLPAIIEDEAGPDLYREEDMDEIMEIVSKGRTHDSYAMKYDIKQFKEDFVNILAALEDTKPTPVFIKEQTHSVVRKVVVRQVQPEIRKIPDKSRIAAAIVAVSAGVVFTTIVAKQRLLR